MTQPINTLDDIVKAVPELRQVLADTKQLTEVVTELLEQARKLVEGTPPPPQM